MPPKAVFEFEDYRGILPYASELFGVYQPLLGWKSRRHMRRFTTGYAVDRLGMIERLAEGVAPELKLEPSRDAFKVLGFKPGDPIAEVATSRSLLVTALRQSLSGRGAVSDRDLAKALDQAAVTKLLQTDVANAVNHRIQAAPSGNDVATGSTVTRTLTLADGRAQLEYEARLAAALLQLKDKEQFAALRMLLSPIDWKQTHTALLSAAASQNPLQQFVPTVGNPLDTLDPNFDLDRVALSPIGIVHLFRQYFFELDTFLGTPVGHVWLSPGTSLELIEVSTRKVVVEKTMERSLETTKKTEMDTTDQDELSDAVKQDNQQDIKFGASVTASYAGVTASSNFDMNNTQKQARETSHKHMREQSTKLSTEIKTNFKTTFKTVTETTDTTSKRYVIQNPSPDKLQNYELRRKMRQVAVQVQDVGTYLCWQTFVDTPGHNLDLATLVHIAQPADLESIPHPEAPAPLEHVTKPYMVDFPYQNISDGDDMEVVFDHGDDHESWPDHNDLIVWQRDFQLDSPSLGYKLDLGSLQITSQHSDVCVPRVTGLNDQGKVRVALDQVNFAKQPSVKLQITATWNPPPQDLTDYNKKMVEYTNAQLRAQKEAYNKAVQERIAIASKIDLRPADDLREEERILIYRALIQDMLSPKGFGADAKENPPTSAVKDTNAARHVLSELISSIFDVDKMLYFVAPEWWKPHARAVQTFGGNPDPSSVGPVSEANQVGWDGNDGVVRHNYYITETSAPAKLGASLGWVLQLDGDNLRNAFLNAPWVKAVMPIRPGKERAAISWLQHMDGMNGIGPTDLYSGDGTDAQGNPLNGKLMIDVLNLLADTVAKKHEESLTTKSFDLGDPKLPHDPDSTITATPIDRVWEHGFNPLAGGFHARPLSSKEDPAGSEDFQTFDQWVEILPTDQVVPVAVEYDPKTGRMKDPAP
jgi:hypothetical protein